MIMKLSAQHDVVTQPFLTSMGICLVFMTLLKYLNTQISVYVLVIYLATNFRVFPAVRVSLIHCRSLQVLNCEFFVSCLL